MTMVKSTLLIVFGLFFNYFTLLAQDPGIRKISSDYGDTYSQAKQVSQISLRIEEGKVWVNGNLVPRKELPKGLRDIDPNIHYKSAAFGVGEISFNLAGTDYLVKDDQIRELPSRTTDLVPVKDRPSTDAMEEYYSNLKRESPNLFYSLSREAALTERARNLVYEYQLTKGKERAKVKDELRVVLGQLFEINEHNRQKEIIELQQMIDAAQKEIQYRKANQDLIIENTMKELIGE